MPLTKQKRLEEFELIRWIQQQAGNGAHLALGIGDDCSIQPQQPDRDLLTSIDLLIEDIHFKREWSNMFDLGRKSAAVNISDIAAMGGTPQSVFLGIGRPKTIDDTEIKEFLSGFLAEIKTYGAVLTGGDSCGSPGPLMISVTVQGEVPTGDAICRQGASYGDAIYVSGSLGDSALALHQLQHGRQPDAYLKQRFHTPTPRVALGQELSKRHLATAMLDVSDGLIADLGHILAASNVGAELNLDAIPLSAAFKRLLDDDSALIDFALAGGEDYELVFTSPLKDLDQHINLPLAVTRIGSISQQPGLHIRQTNGEPYHCRRGGFDHFS
ncbi:thiamine-phosphate kinase [Desulfuromusa kysingii]|uniref:Thiamine-monophosphate kinase n=1 Tax=Desulfuromusa kysingii TaxID=37625 RepID=A0A1H4ARB0_9BACT|nr:thiamine-phosphate kinase [Desulfuromusa kysingii]SEA38287.1 thiamine-phosphate kinase [Desulfuromusa kysingii]